MTERRQTLIDRTIAHADQALRTVFGEPVGSGRDNPASPVTESELSSSEKAKSISLMRVNHAGEVCAQALYQGQALTARDPAVRKNMERSAAEENDHLDWCEQRVEQGRLSGADLAGQKHEPLASLNPVDQGRETLTVGVSEIQERRIRRHLEGALYESVVGVIHERYS